MNKEEVEYSMIKECEHEDRRKRRELRTVVGWKRPKPKKEFADASYNLRI